MADNSTLKMRFKLNQMEFELEGNQDVVTKQFEDFKSFITEDLLPRMNNAVSNGEAISETEAPAQLAEAKDVTDMVVSSVPTLKEIAIKNLPKTETDWLLVYCYFASGFGKETFTKESIKTLYEQTNRKNDSRVANLSNNIKSLVSKDYIGIYNVDEFLMKQAGINYINEILKGSSTSKTSVTNKRNKKSLKESSYTEKKGTNKKPVKATKSVLLDRSLNLRPDGKESLKEFAERYACDSTPKYITIIVYYLKEILEVDKVNISSIYTCLDELNVRVPSTLNTVINNTKNRNGWLEYDSLEDVSLSVKGRNAIKFDLPKKDS